MWIWALFILLIGIFLALDLGVFHKGAHEISYREATRWTIVWSSVGFLFSFVILMVYHFRLGPGAYGKPAWEAAMEYLTGYVIEIATPLFLALVLIEFTDILFALDSIPAIIGITQDPFLVFTSNIFAILGLRSMYFFIANMLDSFHYLKHSLTVILVYVGVKLILENHYHLGIGLSLAVIFISLSLGVIFSLKYRKSHETIFNF